MGKEDHSVCKKDQNQANIKLHVVKLKKTKGNKYTKYRTATSFQGNEKEWN